MPALPTGSFVNGINFQAGNILMASSMVQRKIEVLPEEEEEEEEDDTDGLNCNSNWQHS